MADDAPVMIRVVDEAGSCTCLNTRRYRCTGQMPEATAAFGWPEAQVIDHASAARVGRPAEAAPEGGGDRAADDLAAIISGLTLIQAGQVGGTGHADRGCIGGGTAPPR